MEAVSMRVRICSRLHRSVHRSTSQTEYSVCRVQKHNLDGVAIVVLWSQKNRSSRKLLQLVTTLGGPYGSGRRLRSCD
ncbi:hypothetical protein KIN20_009775 [Parelaphostrongylus tenuis]|uniref:Uncharacterized protein n=1 Tax=Parelaphostrongylus tenuis TaxID=148309 RepID=A0AAD5MR06_PARTN|nr:hypothetical protein KIN20_009775 [Parelaphostrongylus tenuis]